MSDSDLITRNDVIVQRNGVVWVRGLGGSLTRMGIIVREGRGWRGKCDKCHPFHTAIQRIRKDAVQALIDHWND